MEIEESPAAIVATDQRYLNCQSTLSPLSHVVWRTTTNTTEIGAYITWMDLTVAVTNTKGETQKLLPGLTGYAEPGHIMAIMGPSGSGKSTLIDALAGRLATNAVETGTVLVNGRKRKLAYGSAGYVTQIENLLGNLTVRETIQYSANLRLPNSLSREEKEAIVDGTILEMGLQECERDLLGR